MSKAVGRLIVWFWHRESTTTMELAPSTIGIGIYPHEGLKLEKIQRIWPIQMSYYWFRHRTEIHLSQVSAGCPSDGARENGKEKKKIRTRRFVRRAGRQMRQTGRRLMDFKSFHVALDGGKLSPHSTIYLGFRAGRLLPNEVKYVSRNNVIRYCSLSTIQWHFYLFILRHFLCSDR